MRWHCSGSFLVRPKRGFCPRLTVFAVTDEASLLLYCFTKVRVMNATQIAAFANSVKLLDSGNYEGLPVPTTDRAGLAECAKINAIIGDGPFTANHLKAFDAMLAANAPKPPAKGATGGSTPKLKWAAFPGTKKIGSNGKEYIEPHLPAEALRLYTEFREANMHAADCRTAFMQMASPLIKAAVIKAAGKELPPGKDVLITFKFGRINVAVADASEVASSQAAGLGDLF